MEIGVKRQPKFRSSTLIITDSQIRAYVERLGNRLGRMRCAELNNPVFDTPFTPVNLKDINACAAGGRCSSTAA